METTRDFDYTKIKELIRASSQETSVYVGCDSLIKGGVTDFVLVIVVHYDTKHGAKIFHSHYKEKRRMPLRERLWQEVYMSTAAAMEIVDDVGMRPLQIHLDLNKNEKHDSSLIVKEAISYVRASGFEVRVKDPYNPGQSFAASKAADHYVRS
mgnify:CR=1 FL=1